MIKKSLEAYFLPQISYCTFLKTFSKDGNILPRQSGYSVRSFSNRHKNPEKFKKVALLPCIRVSESWVKCRELFEAPYTNLDNGTACP